MKCSGSGNSAGLVDRAHTNVNKSVSVSDALNSAEEKWLPPLVEGRTIGTIDTKTITITAELTDAEALALAQAATMETEREPSGGRPRRNGLVEFAARKRAAALTQRIRSI
jgi:hypothetical protein